MNYLNEALKRAKTYSRLSEFKRKDPAFYQWAYSSKYFSKITSHLLDDLPNKKPSITKWNLDKAHREALKFNMKEDFRRGSQAALSWARRNNVFDFICFHMDTPYTDWTFEKLHTLALECSSRYDFEKKYKAAYIQAGRNGILDEICSHMKIAYGGFDKSKKGILYYIRVKKNRRTVYKVGITNHSVENRFRSDMKYIEIIKTISFDVGSKAKDLESKILKKYEKYSYKGIPMLKSGNTEMFNFDVLGWDK